MSNHDLLNKMAAVAALLRRADTYCSNATSIDAIRGALAIVLEIGEKAGNKLNKEAV